MIIPQQLVQEVNSFVANESLVLRVDKAVPGFLLEAAENVVVLRVELNFVSVQVVKEVVGAKDLSDLHQLVGVALAVEKWLFSENHRGEHGSKTPHVQAIVVLLEIDEQFGALEITRGHANVVLGTRVVELSEAPVDESQLPVLMIDHNVMRLHIAVHNALAVTEVERLEQLVDVVSNIDVVELGVEGSEICVVDILENERRGLTLSRRGWLVKK